MCACTRRGGCSCLGLLRHPSPAPPEGKRCKHAARAPLSPPSTHNDSGVRGGLCSFARVHTRAQRGGGRAAARTMMAPFTPSNASLTTGLSRANTLSLEKPSSNTWEKWYTPESAYDVAISTVVWPQARVGGGEVAGGGGGERVTTTATEQPPPPTFTHPRTQKPHRRRGAEPPCNEPALVCAPGVRHRPCAASVKGGVLERAGGLHVPLVNGCNTP
jgi:hypothetical protein